MANRCIEIERKILFIAVASFIDEKQTYLSFFKNEKVKLVLKKKKEKIFIKKRIFTASNLSFLLSNTCAVI